MTSKKKKAARGKISPTTKGIHAGREILAVFLSCCGLLTTLSLLSYDPADISFNTSGRAHIHNWIGPAGAYWADLLLQWLGIGAYAIGLGLLFSAWRAFVGRIVRPGFREGTGIALLTVSVGTLAELLTRDEPQPFSPGGVLGAIVARVLMDHFALAGAYILSTSLVLTALTVTADGLLSGLGLRGMGAFCDLWLKIDAFRQERTARQLQRVVSRAAAKDEEPSPSVNPLGNPFPAWQDLKAEKQRRAQEKEKRPQRPSPHKEPSSPQADTEIPQAVKVLGAPPKDHPANAEEFSLGELPILDDEPTGDVDDDHSALSQISIRAATPPPNDEPDDPSIELPESATSAPPLAEAPQIIDARPAVDVTELTRVDRAKEDTPRRDFELPAVSLLDYEASERPPVDPEKLRANADQLTKTLKSYGVEGCVREIRPGPVVTMYEYVPTPGIKLSKIAGLADDIAMSMAALRVRIVAPIPGKGAVGIEIPNDVRETVYLKELIAHDTFRKAKSRLTMALGKDIEGKARVANLATMPHLLVAGATGAGKSVSVNAMIMSVLFSATPEDVRMIMVDPKMLELSVYEGIPHLLLPVVTDPKKAALALRWAVDEMERRYHALSELGVRGIDGYNRKVRDATCRGEALTISPPRGTTEPMVCDHLPYLMVIVDELADLMMVASREVETSIMRLAQMARAAGIHLILATQRPSVDVLTGVIKANFPTRIAFQVASKHDSRTIIDQNGAEHLLGRGDMLYLSPGAGGISRVHGAFVSEEEISRTVTFWRDQGRPQYDESILAPRDEAVATGDDEPMDEMYDQAVAIVAETRQASVSMIQRRLRIGYNRAARLVEQMESEGIVGPADGAKPREVLVSPAA